MPVPVGLWLKGDLALNNILTEDQHERRLGSEKYPLLSGKHSVSFPPSAFNYDAWKAMLTGKPYPIRAMYCQGSNMVLAYANSKMVLEAIKSLDFFACVDFYPNETNRVGGYHSSGGDLDGEGFCDLQRPGLPGQRPFAAEDGPGR